MKVLEYIFNYFNIIHILNVCYYILILIFIFVYFLYTLISSKFFNLLIICLIYVISSYYTVTYIQTDLNLFFVMILIPIQFYTIWLIYKSIRKNTNTMCLTDKIVNLVFTIIGNPIYIFLIFLFIILAFYVRTYLLFFLYADDNLIIYPIIFIFFGTWAPLSYLFSVLTQYIQCYYYLDFSTYNCGVYNIYIPNNVDYSLNNIYKAITIHNANLILISIIFVNIIKFFIFVYIQLPETSKLNFHLLDWKQVAKKLSFQGDKWIKKHLHNPPCNPNLKLCSLNYFSVGVALSLKLFDDHSIELDTTNLYKNISYGQSVPYTTLKSRGFTYTSEEGNIIENPMYREKYCFINKDECVTRYQMRHMCSKLFNELYNFVPNYPLFDDMDAKDHYMDHPILRKQYDLMKSKPNEEFQVKGLMSGILQHYFKLELDHLPVSENRNNYNGIVDHLIKTLDKDGNMSTLVIVELKSEKGAGWGPLLEQSYEYLDKDNNITNPFFIGVKDDQIAFFIYEPDYHSSRNFGLKGTIFDGFLSLYADAEGVKIVPQENTLVPQVQPYTLFSENPHQKIPQHMIFKYMASCKQTPYEVDDGITNLPLPDSLSVYNNKQFSPLYKNLACIGTKKSLGIDLHITSDGCLSTINPITTV